MQPLLICETYSCWVLKLGGMPFEILATTFTTVQETQYVPFEFHLDGRNSRANIGDHIVFDLEPIQNPVTAQPEFVKVEHSTGFIFRDAEAVADLAALPLRLRCDPGATIARKSGRGVLAVWRVAKSQ